MWMDFEETVAGTGISGGFRGCNILQGGEEVKITKGTAVDSLR